MNLSRTLLTAAFLIAAPASSMAGVFISINIAPPVLPVYEQPPCPEEGDLWTPGYWAYAAPTGYYWVPGTWVPAPEPGYLWTPGYWGFASGLYGWHQGYWGSHVGFYGGVDYGYGYTGNGFYGGRWDGGHFLYNTAVMRVNTNVIHNVYNERVENNGHNRASFNGPGGVVARPSQAEEAAAHERHIEATSVQAEHEHSAAANRSNFVSQNHGHPVMAAVARPIAHAVAAHAMASRPVSAARPVNASRPPVGASRPAVASHTVSQPRPQVSHAVSAPRQEAARPTSSYHPAAAPQHTVAPHAAAPPQHAAPQHAAPQHEAAHAPAGHPAAEHKEKH